MQYPLATRESAISLVKDMSEKLPGLAERLAKKHGMTRSGKKEYTKAIWHYLEDLRKTRGWTLWPKKPPIGGRVKGEYLTDFSLCDEDLGYRIACESEWGNFKCIEWAFDKLRAVKADTKVLIFQAPHTNDGRLPDEISKLFRGNFAKCGHHHPNHEVYVFIQFDGDSSKCFIWTPTKSGPLDEDSIYIEPIN
jgi:hypothetical protein